MSVLPNLTVQNKHQRMVFANITVHVKEVARCNGGHLEHLIHGGYIPMQWSFFLYASL
jgi:hypothetical protein